MALASATVHRAPTWPPIVWLGRVSYSLYLTHTLVQLVMLHAFGRWLFAWALLIACVPLTLWVSQLAHHWVERPASSLGRRLTTAPQRRGRGPGSAAGRLSPGLDCPP